MEILPVKKLSLSILARKYLQYKWLEEKGMDCKKYWAEFNEYLDASGRNLEEVIEASGNIVWDRGGFLN